MKNSPGWKWPLIRSLKRRNNLMKITKRHLLVSTLALLALAPNASRVLAQGTAFTYQGRLNDGTNAASGNYDLRFFIFDVPAGGSSIAGPITNANVSISGGFFTPTPDFGPAVFDGSPRWLQIGVRTNGGGSFTATSPRPQITPSPYAIFSSMSASMSNG